MEHKTRINYIPKGTNALLQGRGEGPLNAPIRDAVAFAIERTLRPVFFGWWAFTGRDSQKRRSLHFVYRKPRKPRTSKVREFFESRRNSHLGPIAKNA